MVRGVAVRGWTVMARRKGSLWHDPLVVVGAEENNGDVVDGRNSALRGGGRRGRGLAVIYFRFIFEKFTNYY